MDCLDGKWWNRTPLVRPPETITSLMLAALYPLASKTLAAPARMVARVATALRCRRGFVVSGVEPASTSIELLKACRSILWLSALTVFAHRQGIFMGVEATSRTRCGTAVRVFSRLCQGHQALLSPAELLRAAGSIPASSHRRRSISAVASKSSHSRNRRRCIIIPSIAGTERLNAEVPL